MKFSVLSILPLCVFFAACGAMKAPLSNDGNFNPLSKPGIAPKTDAPSVDTDFVPGRFVSASIPNTAFFKKRPKGNEDADKLLSVGTNMKIISNDSSYVKIELDSGEIGWVPSVMVSETTTNNTPIDGAYQVYPPLPAGTEEAIPLIDPSALPPDGAIPTIIDPMAEADIVKDLPKENSSSILPAAAGASSSRPPSVTVPTGPIAILPGLPTVSPSVATPKKPQLPIVKDVEEAGKKAKEQLKKITSPN